MRKILSSIMLVAAAAMAFTSCQKEENVAPETISTTLTMHADVDATKTYLGEDNQVLWGTGEAVQLYVGAGETSKFVPSASTDDHNGNASASFTFDISDVETAETYSLGGIYPASAAMNDNADPAKFKVILPQTQNAEVGKYDPSAYVMVLKPETVNELPEEYTASFRRATALNKITLTNVAEDITSVEITVPEGQYLAGRRYFDLTTGESGDVYYDKSSTIAVNSAFTGETIDVWFCSWGVELAAGEELTIRMKSANSTYTRTITARESGIKFIEGDLNTLTINMEEATKENASDFEGEWLITGTTSGTSYAATAYSSGNNLKSVQITIADDGSITEVDGLDQCKMTFTKITEGEYEGMYTIQDAGGKYLYAASSNGNQLKGGSSANSANYYWTVECNDGAYSIVASKSSNRNVMQFNPNNGSPIFSCYSSASQTAIALYPYSNVKPDTTPKILVDGETTKNIGSEGGEVTFDYTLKNLDGETLDVAVSDLDMLSVSATDGVLTVTVYANEGEERSATITLTCGEAAEVVLTVNQNEYVEPGEGGGETVTTYKFVAGDLTAGTSYNNGTVNGDLAYKLGSSSNTGTLTFPAGYKEITFYAVGWTSGTNKLSVTNGTINGETSVTLTNDTMASGTINNGFTKTGTFDESYKFTVSVTNTSSTVQLSLKRGIVWGFEGVLAN